MIRPMNAKSNFILGISIAKIKAIRKGKNEKNLYEKFSFFIKLKDNIYYLSVGLKHGRPKAVSTKKTPNHILNAIST